MTINLDPLERATVDLMFALRDSLTDRGPSFVEFWSGGRCESAIRAAAAGATDAAEAVSKTAHQLQIDQYTVTQSPEVVRIVAVIGPRFQEWKHLVKRKTPYLRALADVERAAKRDPKPEPAPKPMPEPVPEAMF